MRSPNIRREDRERLGTSAFRKRVKERAEVAIAEAYDNIDDAVKHALDGVIKEMVPALLGLAQEGFGRGYRISQMNGIDREHPLGAELRRAAQDKAEQIAAKSLHEYKPTKQVLQSANKYYRECLDRAVMDRVEALAFGQANEWADKYIADLLEAAEDGFDEAKVQATLKSLATARPELRADVEALAGKLS